MDRYVVGYGSLVDKASAELTLKHPIHPDDFSTCRLDGFKRIWNLKEDVFSEEKHKEITAVFLNIKEKVKSHINCSIFKVTEAEFENLKTREKNYEAIDVADKVYDYDQTINLEGSKVMVFMCEKEEHLARKRDKDHVFIMKKYRKLVNKAFESVHPDFLDEYIDTTKKSKFKVIKGGYTFTNTEQAAMVEPAA